MSYIATWSSGKDSGYACYKAMQDGYNISYLLNLISRDSKKVNSHGIDKKLIQLQAKLTGIPIIQSNVSWETYTHDFKNAINEINDNDKKGIIFGDLYLPEFEIQRHKKWGEKICGELGVEAVEPLWNKNSEEVFLEMLEAGFQSVIVSCKKDLFDKEWLGHYVDRDLLQYLKKNNIEVCGEKGEYHTFIIDCPLFSKKINIKKSKKILRDDYWFLDIIEYSS